jgi:formylglycine-generating enzyme required for sulfatase activity
MNPASDRQFGEYQLRELLEETEQSYRWLAEQLSISRLVLLDELRTENATPATREAFLADVRAKAAIDHPLISSVFEAVSEPHLCFYTHELLNGPSLADQVSAKQPLRPAEVVFILRRVCEAYLQYETLNQATMPLCLEAIHIDEHNVVRIENLARAGSRLSDESTRDILFLGTALVPLDATGHPGSNRLLTLLGWMRGLEIETPLTWSQIREVCLQIEEQLTDPAAALPHNLPRASRKRRSKVLPYILLATVVIGGAVMLLRQQPASAPVQAGVSLPEPITVPAGKYPTADGDSKTLPPFKISAHEVTIRQYAEFLDTLEGLAKDGRQTLFDLPDQAPAKTSHLPNDWPALYAAAKSSGTWQGLPVTLDSPVVGIDWWDASSYAESKQARLPTQAEWFAALSYQTPDPKILPVSLWTTVSPQSTDRTPAGLLGMAGSLCEWTQDHSANPANPLGEEFWVITGGSFLKSGSNALSREWVSDRSTRRPDLGFRLVFESP